MKNFVTSYFQSVCIVSRYQISFLISGYVLSCARIEQQLGPNQILIDDNSYNRIRTSLGKMSWILTSLHSTLDLKDFGPTRVFFIH
jgi:hypothetical protein